MTGLRGAPMLAWFRHRDAAMKPLSLASLRHRLSRWVLLADQSAPA